MIKITKTASQKPSIKYTSGPNRGKDKLEVATEDLIKLYDEDKEAYDNGSKKFDFKSSLYGHDKVKKALKKLQAKKCCFCEAFVSHIAHGDIEHFRPKAGYVQNASDSLQKPGYFWLAYDWKNLYFSCQICNQRHKKNLFPLTDPSKRAKKPGDSINVENPLFIDPGKVDPSDHITFVGDKAVPVDDSELGTATIDQLGLNRDDLREDRLQTLSMLRIISNAVPSMPAGPEKTEAIKMLSDRKKPSSEYSAMINANI